MIDMEGSAKFSTTIVAFTALAFVLSLHIRGREMSIASSFTCAAKMAVLPTFFGMLFCPAAVGLSVLGAVSVVMPQFIGVNSSAVTLSPTTSVIIFLCAVCLIVFSNNRLPSLRIGACPLPSTLMHTLSTKRIKAFRAMRFVYEFRIWFPSDALAADFARLGFVEHQTISHWLTGKYPPTKCGGHLLRLRVRQPVVELRQSDHIHIRQRCNDGFLSSFDSPEYQVWGIRLLHIKNDGMFQNKICDDEKRKASNVRHFGQPPRM